MPVGEHLLGTKSLKATHAHKGGNKGVEDFVVVRAANEWAWKECVGAGKKKACHLMICEMRRDELLIAQATTVTMRWSSGCGGGGSGNGGGDSGVQVGCWVVQLVACLGDFGDESGSGARDGG